MPMMMIIMNMTEMRIVMVVAVMVLVVVPAMVPTWLIDLQDGGF